MKKMLKIAIIAVVLLAGLGGGLYYYYRQSPIYSLKMAAEAFQTNNQANIEKYVDLEYLLNDIFDKEFLQDPKMDESPLARQVLSFLKPSFVSMLKDVILQSIEEAIEEQKAQNDTKADSSSPQKKVVKSVKVLQKKGKIAIVEVRLYSKNGQEIPIELEMQKMGNYWQIKTVHNSSQIIQLMGLTPEDFSLEENPPQ